MLRIERLRLASGEPMAIETTHLSAKRFPALRRSLVKYTSLYTALAEVYDVRLAEAEETIETSLATPREAGLLGTDVGLPMLMLSRHSLDAEGEPVEWVRRYTAATATSSWPGCSGRRRRPSGPRPAADRRPLAGRARGRSRPVRTDIRTGSDVQRTIPRRFPALTQMIDEGTTAHAGTGHHRVQNGTWRVRAPRRARPLPSPSPSGCSSHWSAPSAGASWRSPGARRSRPPGCWPPRSARTPSPTASTRASSRTRC